MTVCLGRIRKHGSEALSMKFYLVNVQLSNVSTRALLIIVMVKAGSTKPNLSVK